MRPRTRILFAAGLLAVAAALAAPPPPAARPQDVPIPDLSTEDGLRRVLDDLEQRWEQAARRVGAAVAGRLAGKAQDDHRAELEAWESLAAAYDDPRLEAVLSRWLHRRTVTRDPALTRRVHLWAVTRRAAQVELDPQVRRRTLELSERLGRFPYTLDGREASREELERILRTSADRARRKRAWLALAEAGRQLQQDVKALVRLRAVKARGTITEYFHHLVYEANDIDQTVVYSSGERAAGRTRQMQESLLSRLRETLGVEALDPWDLDHAIEVRSRRRLAGTGVPELDGAERSAATARTVLRAIGFQQEPEAVLVPLLPAPGIGLPVEIPGRHATLLRPPPTARTVLFEAGRALQTASTRAEAPLLKGYPWIPGARNAVYDEAMGEVMAAWLHDPLVLREALGMTPAQAEAYLEDLKERELLAWRRRLLDQGFEFTMYVNPDADLDERWRLLYFKSIGLKLDPSLPLPWPATWAYIEAPGTSINGLLAPAVAQEVHALLREKLGDGRVREGRAAAYLIEACFSGGESLPLGERLARSTTQGYEMGRYLEWLGAPSPAPRSAGPPR
ncbi:MAG TPA: hypothetical protein VJV23_15620 [Candidatus Polarisedimenticolia bacterium]|nr:hypothetical protein [Candidatus Polarisedimenticolia bacterium]